MYNQQHHSIFVRFLKSSFYEVRRMASFSSIRTTQRLQAVTHYFTASSVPVQYHYLSKSKQYYRIDCLLNDCMFFIASMATEQYFPGRTKENASLTWQTSRWYCEKARRHRWTYYADRTCAP